MNDWMLEPGSAGKPTTIYDVAEIVGQAFPLAFTPNNITHSFQVSGLHPLNEIIFKDYEFLPSSVTDRPMPMSFDQPGTQSGPIEDNSDRTEPISFEGQPETQSLSYIEYNSSTPGTSSNNGVTQHSPASFQNQISSNLVSPEELRPYPKAQPQKESKKGRPKGKSCILTLTPIKIQIEKKAEKAKKAAEKAVKIAEKGEKKKNILNNKKKWKAD